MDTQTLLVILIPSVLSILVTASNLVFNYLKEARRKQDKVWDLAAAIALKALEKSHNEFLELDSSIDIAKYLHQTLALLNGLDTEDYAAFASTFGKHSQSTEEREHPLC